MDKQYVFLLRCALAMYSTIWIVVLVWYYVFWGNRHYGPIDKISATFHSRATSSTNSGDSFWVNELEHDLSRSGASRIGSSSDLSLQEIRAKQQERFMNAQKQSNPDLKETNQK
eukprot:646271_1